MKSTVALGFFKRGAGQFPPAVCHGWKRCLVLAWKASDTGSTRHLWHLLCFARTLVCFRLRHFRARHASRLCRAACWGADFLAPTAQVERMNVRGWSLYNHKDRKWSVDWGAQATCVGALSPCAACPRPHPPLAAYPPPNCCHPPPPPLSAHLARVIGNAAELLFDASLAHLQMHGGATGAVARRPAAPARGCARQLYGSAHSVFN